MQVIFFPALGENVQIPISKSRIPSDAVVLHFRASLGREDFIKVEQGSARVQLWSNLPVPHDRTDRGWKELDFEIAAVDEKTVTVPHSHPLTPNSSRWLSLASFDQGEEHAPVKELSLHVSVDLTTFVGEQAFAFTYRVLHSDGSITWLGSFGKNGVVVLQGNGKAEVELGEAWREAADVGHGYVTTLSDGTSGHVVANISSLGDYQLWAFDKYLNVRASTSALIRDARVVILLPRCKHACRYFHKPAYVLSATQGALLNASPSTGEISGVGPGALLFQSCYDLSQRLETLLQIALMYSGIVDRVRILRHDNEWISLLSPRDQSPTKGLVIPTGVPSSSNYTRVDIDVASLAECLTSPLKEGVPPQFCVFSPSTYDLEFIDTTPELDADANSNPVISFFVPNSGGEFTLSKVYDLTSEGECKITILSPYASVSQGDKPIILPTPPPSPPPRNQSNDSQPIVTFSPKLTIIPPPSDGLDSGEVITEIEPELSGERRPSPPRRRGLLGAPRRLYSLATFYVNLFLYLLLFVPLGRRLFSIIGGKKAEVHRGTVNGEYPVGATERDDVVSDVEMDDPSGGASSEGEVEEAEQEEEEEEEEEAQQDEVPTSPTAQAPLSTPLEELLSAELNPHLDIETNGKVWGKLAMVIIGTAGHDASIVPFSPLPLSILGKAISLNGDVPNNIVARFLKEHHYSVEFAVPSVSGQVMKFVKIS